jgi:hypothetical protein
MNRNGKVDIVALITVIMMAIAIVGIAYQFGRIDEIRAGRQLADTQKYTIDAGKPTERQRADTQKQTVDAGKPTTFEKVEQIFRPNIVAARVEKRRLEMERGRLLDVMLVDVKELNEASMGLSAAIDKYNRTDSSEVEREALSEEAGRLEACNRLMSKLLNTLTKLVETVPAEQRSKVEDQLLKIKSSTTLVQAAIKESDGYIRQYVEGKPRDEQPLNHAIEAHRKALRAFSEGQSTFFSLARSMFIDAS